MFIRFLQRPISYRSVSYKQNMMINAGVTVSPPVMCVVPTLFVFLRSTPCAFFHTQSQSVYLQSYPWYYKATFIQIKKLHSDIWHHCIRSLTKKFRFKFIFVYTPPRLHYWFLFLLYQILYRVSIIVDVIKLPITTYLASVLFSTQAI